MNFRQMTTEQIALIITGLEAIYVQDSERTRLAMIEKCKVELAQRGFALAA